MTANFPAKLILFGEYTIINNSTALAIPFEKYQGKISFDAKESSSSIESNIVLQKIFQYLLDRFFIHVNTSLLEEDLQKGIWFDSAIPQGYGLGSSGALVAALYQRYFVNKASEPKKIKQTLAEIESFFHGTSSGLDPLVSYLNKMLIINSDKSIEIVENTIDSKSVENSLLFVIDCGFARQSSNLVNNYLDMCKNSSFESNFILPMKDAVSSAIDSFFHKKESISHAFGKISTLQYIHLKKMIPIEFHTLWEEGLKSKDYYLKLCGAGGGGFILGYCPDKIKYKSLFDGFKTTIVMEL